jgi:hypothetical protein
LLEEVGLHQVGVTQFTRIPWLVNSLPRDLVRPIAPALEAL